MDCGLFLRTYEALIKDMGIKPRIPKVIGRTEVDLHRLYCQVTGFGGLEAVINGKLWATVCEPFNFPVTFTSRSFVVKRLYIDALHHYEQVGHQSIGSCLYGYR